MKHDTIQYPSHTHTKDHSITLVEQEGRQYWIGEVTDECLDAEFMFFSYYYFKLEKRRKDSQQVNLSSLLYQSPIPHTVDW